MKNDKLIKEFNRRVAIEQRKRDKRHRAVQRARWILRRAGITDLPAWNNPERNDAMRSRIWKEVKDERKNREGEF